MANVAIIPARGGSKRIPRKNIKDFLGKPIIAYSIESAVNSGIFDEVMVSTDDQEIAEIAVRYGAKVPFFRSKDNSDDFATTVDVLLEVVHSYESAGMEFEIGCCIYPTAPLINAGNIKKSLDVLKSGNFDSVFTTVPYSYPIQRSLKLDAQGKISMNFEEYKSARSQDLEKVYHDAGQFYTFKIETLRNKRNIWTENTGAIILDELEVQDIDSLTDWKLAEMKFELLNDR